MSISWVWLAISAAVVLIFGIVSVIYGDIGDKLATALSSLFWVLLVSAIMLGLFDGGFIVSEVAQ